MIIAKQNPVGVDVVLARIQSRVHDYLVQNFNWSTDDYNAYERVYLNETDEGRIPEVFKGNSDLGQKEYKEIYFNDKKTAESYFIVENPSPYGDGLFRADVGMVFQVNLRKLYPTIQHRADEECHRQVLFALEEWRALFGEINNLITGYDSYRGLAVEKKKLDYMHPCHIFRINLSVYYPYAC